MGEVTFTIDVEDPRPSEALPQRYDHITRQILALLNRLRITGSFFFVGELARSNPQLIRDVADAGQEVALHSLNHTPLPMQSPKQFRKGLELG